MHVVITRPREDADDLAADVAARGQEPVLAPLLEIELVRPAGVDLGGALSGVQALAFTSSNGVRAAAHLNLPRQLPVFAVGDATAQSAEAAGFRQVESASGDAAALARLIRRRLDNRDGPVLHLSGEAIAGRLAEDLQASGFALRRVIGYRARPVQRLPDALERLLDEEEERQTLKAMMIFSPRTAETFVRLVTEAGKADRCTSLVAICLSPEVAERLQGFCLHGVRTASRPDRAGMLAALDALGAAAQASGGSRRGQ